MMTHNRKAPVRIICEICERVCECACLLTVDDHLDHPEVDLSPGQDSSLAGVRALVVLLDAANLKAVGCVGEAHWSRSSSRRRGDRETGSGG